MGRRNGFACRLLGSIGVLALASGIVLAGRVGYVEVKALLAEHLIGCALEAYLRDGRAHAPWSWADTHPIAVLAVERLGVHRAVLAGASGTSMAFGIGHLDGTALPNRSGNCVLAGHRDRAFAFLERLEVGDRLTLTSALGTRAYVVESAEVVPETDVRIVEDSGGDRLTLVTCYPFDGLLRSSERYVVTCGLASRV